MGIELEAELKKIELDEEINNSHKKINNLKEQSKNEYDRLILKINNITRYGYCYQIEQLGLKTKLAKHLYIILGWRNEGDSGTVEEAEIRDNEWINGLNLLINKEDISSCIDAMDYVYIEFYRCGKFSRLNEKFIELLNQYKNKKEFVDYINLIEELKDKINIKEKQLKILDKYIN